MHAKIVPDWMPPKSAIINTFVSPPKPPPMTPREIKLEKEGIMSDQLKQEAEKQNQEKDKDNQSGQQTPQTALA